MYCVKWWDAYGMCQISEKMPLEAAIVFRDSMHTSQEAMLVFINK